MSELQSQFESAIEAVKQLSQRPSNEDLLELYAYFKQATEGDVTGSRPGLFDFKAGAKYDAWEKVKGMGSEDAMQGYLKTVERLKNNEA